MSEAAKFAERLKQQVTIDDVFTGVASPSDVEAKSRAWPTRSEWSDVKLVSVVEDGPRRVEEYLFTPADGGPLQPVGVMFTTEDGVRRARLYGNHHWSDHRPLMSAVDPHIEPANGPDDILRAYFEALANADLEATMATWAEDGYLQHSYGDVYKGHERLRQDFTKFFSQGPLKLRYCNKTDDGVTCVLEAHMPHGRQALAVYQRTADGKKMQAARLYL